MRTVSVLSPFTRRMAVRSFFISAMIGFLAAFGLSKCEGPGPHPFTKTASIATVNRHTPPPFVFWFTQIPQRLEPMECQVVPQFAHLFQGMQVRVCVPYYLNWPPTPNGKVPALQRITHP